MLFISEHKILYFTFIFHRTEPSPIELISQFLSVSPEVQCQNPMDVVSPDLDAALNTSEVLKLGRKQLALKILGLKVASHLKWNLGNKIFTIGNYNL